MIATSPPDHYFTRCSTYRRLTKLASTTSRAKYPPKSSLSTCLSLARERHSSTYQPLWTTSASFTLIDLPSRSTHSGVCHSDLGIMTDRWEVLPLSTQSGQVGRVVKFCPGANFGAMELGDRVGIKWINGICGSCRPCLGGRDGLCFCQRISGYYTPGSFRQSLTPIPKDLPSDLAAPMLCAGVAAYSALKKSGAKSGDWIVLLGAGGGVSNTPSTRDRTWFYLSWLAKFRVAGPHRLPDRLAGHGHACHRRRLS